MFTPTDEGELIDIPRLQQDPFLDWCIHTNGDPSSNEARQAYFDEVAAWDQAHDRTATCTNPDCQGGMKNDGRDYCSHRCYRMTRMTTATPTATPNPKEIHA